MSDTKTTKTKVGIVVSNKMNKSIVVETERQVRHKIYGKYMRINDKYMAHDPSEIANMGDKVLIEQCRPISKNKRWLVRKVIEKAL